MQGEQTKPAKSLFTFQHGRRYLRDSHYPLPTDLPELQRQNLETLLATTVFGKPVCSPSYRSRAPTKVLDVGCGSGYWAATCHDHFAAQGHRNISFTGVDIVEVAPDLGQQGLDWRFVKHDLRKVPLPFNDAEFDLVIMKDMNLVVQAGLASERLMDEAIRVLRKGGWLEIWESDRLIRALPSSEPSPPPDRFTPEYRQAAATASFPLTPGLPFSATSNRFLSDANTWIKLALERRRVLPMPSSRIAPMLLQEPEALCNVGFRRVAVPFGEMRWEWEKHEALPSRKDSGYRSSRPKSWQLQSLTDEQAALRHTALLVEVQFLESLEPLLKEVSGKNQEEWQRWWSSMMVDLLEERKASGGECLEMGAWWAQKI